MKPLVYKGEPNRHGRKARKMAHRKYMKLQDSSLKEQYRLGLIGQVTGLNIVSPSKMWAVRWDVE
jgi:hypothetical protein